MLFLDASSGKILYRKFVKNETNRDYLDGLRYIAERGTIIKAVVCDGHMGFLQAIRFCLVQMLYVVKQKCTGANIAILFDIFIILFL